MKTVRNIALAAAAALGLSTAVAALAADKPATQKEAGCEGASHAGHGQHMRGMHGGHQHGKQEKQQESQQEKQGEHRHS